VDQKKLLNILPKARRVGVTEELRRVAAQTGVAIEMQVL
jgi:hypothetical protein